ETCGTFAGELPREIVDAAHPFDCHEERFIAAQARIRELGDLDAEVVLEFVDIDVVNRPAAQQVGSPLPDLRFDARFHGRLHHCGPSAVRRGGAGSWTDCQAFRRASETVSHWRRCSASAFWPAD